MSRALWLIVPIGALVGCRFDFDRLHDDANMDGGPADAPPIPAAICKVDRYPMAVTPTMTDLAVAPTSDGFAAVWLDSTGALPAQGVRLGPNHQLLSQTALGDITDTVMGGVADAGKQLVIATATGGREAMRIRQRDLSPMQLQTTLTSHVTGHYPYPSEVSLQTRIFITGALDSLEMSYVSLDGLTNLSASNIFGAAGTVTELACADGPDHSHCTSAEQPNGLGTPTSCFAFDVRYDNPSFPEIPGRSQVSDDCQNIRCATGDPPRDSMIVVWTTQAGAVQTKYLDSKGNVPPNGDVATIAPAGSAPKIEFDGVRFWIAWLDGGGELQLSSFDLQGNGIQVNYSLAGWVPRGPKAYELVRRGTDLELMVVRDGELDLLSVCN